MERPRSGKPEEIREGLKVCSVWVHDGHGDAKKDCPSCPFRNPADPAGMNCGEHLMHDAGLLIDEQKKRIELLEEKIRVLTREKHPAMKPGRKPS